MYTRDKYLVGDTLVFRSGSPPFTVIGSKWNRMNGYIEYELVYFKRRLRENLIKNYSYDPEAYMVLIPEPVLKPYKTKWYER